MSCLVAMPCYGAMLHVAAARSLLEIQDLVDDLLVTEGESAITRGRSNLLTTFLETGYDTLFMLDADCAIERGDFERLLALEAPVRGAAVSLKTLDMTPCLNAIRDGKRLTRDEMPDEPFEVDLIGGACLMVERHVALLLTAQHPELAYTDWMGREATHLFHEIVAGGSLLTEDYAFCRRAKDSGFSIWCDPAIRIGHYEGRMVWKF